MIDLSKIKDSERWLYHNEPGPSYGYLNIPEIVKRCPQAVFFFFIGLRQAGKTYGALEYMHDIGASYFFLRRTEKELNLQIGKNFNYWKDRAAFPWAENMKVENVERGIRALYMDEESTTPFCIAANLANVGAIRGFGASYIDWIVFDEFIGSPLANKRFAEGEAVKDIYETINSNREVYGQDPVKCMFLANANDINTPILQTFGVQSDFLRMNAKGQLFSYIPERRVCLVNLSKSPVAMERAKGALYQCCGDDDSYSRMSLNNEFAQLDKSGIKSLDIKSFLPLIAVDGITIWKHKSNHKLIYCTDGENPAAEYHYNTQNPTHAEHFLIVRRNKLPPVPRDGEEIFYASYTAKATAYNLLKLTK